MARSSHGGYSGAAAHGRETAARWSGGARMVEGVAAHGRGIDRVSPQRWCFGCVSRRDGGGRRLCAVAVQSAEKQPRAAALRGRVRHRRRRGGGLVVAPGNEQRRRPPSLPKLGC
ncbi:hypothetical protein SESBI_50227 [Sesbania bispinosa]|nr:hypothetical protein SESBI_50227 [Sesbania bispinosa]